MKPTPGTLSAGDRDDAPEPGIKLVDGQDLGVGKDQVAQAMLAPGLALGYAGHHQRRCRVVEQHERHALVLPGIAPSPNSSARADDQ